ncbi:hypothetical protein EK21DRAFT_117715 [Setomelanomma holmii]|uniref:Uncharacterized protein n=1 Tax=Setomelanomma holmii TaxID=210430 RepID=A0A9P4GXJ7_9PLEO|nr:hypothetical protein EK21DRAFT_117715 [Setomelanomma holmii]
MLGTRIELLIPLSHVCKELHDEFLPLYFSKLEVSLELRVLNDFLRTFCRTFHEGKLARLQCPKSIAVFIGCSYGQAEGIRCPPTNLLPLIKLRLCHPELLCALEPNPRLKGDSNICRNASVYDRIEQDCRELTSLLEANDKKWRSLVQERKLAKIVLDSWEPANTVNVELMFKQQPPGRKIDAPLVQCYLPDVRRLGLETVYWGTRLVLGMSLIQ